MPYDPSLPLPNSPLESQVIRDQLQALFNLINNIVTLTTAQVGSVTTLPPTDPAAVTVSVVGSQLNFTFRIPKGEMGPPGPPFANAVVDTVLTLNPGDPASAGVTFDGTNLRFSFAIPRGNDGSGGSQRAQGNEGPQGQPGEVSAAALTAAINGTSANTNAVSTLDTAFADPEMEAIRQKLNEMILNGRR